MGSTRGFFKEWCQQSHAAPSDVPSEPAAGWTKTFSKPLADSMAETSREFRNNPPARQSASIFVERRSESSHSQRSVAHACCRLAAILARNESGIAGAGVEAR